MRLIRLLRETMRLGHPLVAMRVNQILAFRSCYCCLSGVPLSVPRHGKPIKKNLAMVTLLIATEFTHSMTFDDTKTSGIHGKIYGTMVFYS